tara:strand:+ start:2626 stop:3240 length:615 start_codon:yes stop_codon:yes gene_type:complete
MIKRKKKLKLIQLGLLLLALIIIFFTYTNKNTYDKTFDTFKANVKKDASNEKVSDEFNIFYNIEYSGIDLSGNRYILKSEEAKSEKLEQEVINMKGVTAFFYFKDDAILEIRSKFGIYNNKTLDMKFDQEIKAKYNNSTLNANTAEYLNSKGSLKISGDVSLIDAKGKLAADILTFDLKKQTLDIESNNNNYVNTLLKLNEKKF